MRESASASKLDEIYRKSLQKNNDDAPAKENQEDQIYPLNEVGNIAGEQKPEVLAVNGQLEMGEIGSNNQNTNQNNVLEIDENDHREPSAEAYHRFLYGHSLEHVVYNVHNLRSLISNIVNESQSTGGVTEEDSRGLSRLNDSLSTALNNLQRGLLESSNDRPTDQLFNEIENLRNILNPEMIAEEIRRRNTQEQQPNQIRRPPSGPNSTIFNKLDKIGKEISAICSKLVLQIKIFFSHPDNIIKSSVLFLSCLFYYSYQQMPEIKNDEGQIFDWLAFNKNARMIILVRFLENI